MNLKSLQFLTFLACFLFFDNCIFAVNTAPAKAAITSENLKTTHSKQTKKLLKKEVKKQNKSSRIAKKIAKIQEKGINNPARKWMWFWIIGWVVAGLCLVLLASADVFYCSDCTTELAYFIIGGLALLFGTISLVIWLIKLNG